MLQGGGAQELIKDRSTKAEEMKQVLLKAQMIIWNFLQMQSAFRNNNII